MDIRAEGAFDPASVRARLLAAVRLLALHRASAVEERLRQAFQAHYAHLEFSRLPPNLRGACEGLQRELREHYRPDRRSRLPAHRAVELARRMTVLYADCVRLL